MEGGRLIEMGAYYVFLSTNCNFILAKSLKGRVHGLAHAHESKCCFSPVYVVVSTQAILFQNIVKEPIRSE